MRLKIKKIVTVRKTLDKTLLTIPEENLWLLENIFFKCFVFDVVDEPGYDVVAAANHKTVAKLAWFEKRFADSAVIILSDSAVHHKVN